MEQKVIKNHPACINCPDNCCLSNAGRLWLDEQELQRMKQLSRDMVIIIKEGDRVRMDCPCLFLKDG